MNDIVSGVVLGLFGPLHMALGLNHYVVAFVQVFIEK